MKGKKELLTQVHVSLAFFFIFTAYGALEVIQSSLNFESGLGTISISFVYLGYLTSCLFVGAPAVYLITAKWSLFFSFFSHTLFIVANVWPSWATMVPTSLILGLSAGPYWIAQGTYATVLAVQYSEKTNSNLEHVAAKFSGIFHVFFGASKPVGNFISSLVLNRKYEDVNYENGIEVTESIVYDTSHILSLPSAKSENPFFHNNNTSLLSTNIQNQNEETQNSIIVKLVNNVSTTFMPSTIVSKSEICGPNHCPYMSSHQEILEKPEQYLIYIMMGTLLVFNILGILCTVFLKNISASKGSGLKQRLFSSVTIMKELNMVLLIIPCILIGIIPGTYYATFSQSVITCTYGIGLVGYAMVCEGVGFTVASLFCSHLTKYVPRVIHNVLALAFFIAVVIWWLFWIPGAEEFWLVVVISVLYGMMHGMYRTHIAGLISLLFPDKPEPAFAQYNIWVAVGFGASFAYTNFLCFRMKIYIFIAVLLLTLLSYLTLEFKIRNLKYNQNKQDSKDEKENVDCILVNASEEKVDVNTASDGVNSLMLNNK